MFEDIYEKTDEKINEKINEKKELRESMSKNQKVSHLLNLISSSNENCSVYIETVIKTLSFIRPKGYCELNDFNYNLLFIIFVKILEENPKNDYMIKNVLILSQTFYKKEDDEKIYLQQKIKGLEIFNSPETWHRCINYSLCYANTDKDLTVQIDKNELIAKINKEAFTTVVTFLCDLKMFTEKENVYEKVKYFYSKIYNLDEKLINQTVEDYIESHNKKLKKKELAKSQKNESLHTHRELRNSMKKAYNEYANEIMKSETIDKKERLLKSERKESIKNEEIIINNNEENKRKDSEIIELQQLINNVEIPEDLKENIQKKNFFNFEDSIFDSFQDNENIITNLENNENLINIIKDENNE
jgi:hypothetical protein